MDYFDYYYQREKFLVIFIIQSSEFLKYYSCLLSMLVSGEKLDPLSWDLRVQIALDVARGLEYLHDGVSYFLVAFSCLPFPFSQILLSMLLCGLTKKKFSMWLRIDGFLFCIIYKLFSGSSSCDTS